MIEVRDVFFDYHKGSLGLFKNINIHICAGETTSLIGQNGCGKSTLVKLLCGQIKANSGNITIMDKDISEYTPKELAKAIGLLPQSRDIPSMTVKTLITHGRFPHLGFPRRLSSEDENIIASSIEKVRVKEIANKNLQEISGGERQRAYIGMLLCQCTPILVLDEPMTYLDINHQLEFYPLIKSLKKTIVMVAHDVCAALIYSDKVCLIDKGEIAICDTPQRVYESKEIQRVYNVELEKTDKGFLLYRN